MSSEDPQHRRKNNYKLLVDPELVKGKKKLYRLNGAIPGKAPIPDPKDPRVLKTVLGVDGSYGGLRVPRFKYDKFWTCSPPLREILISGLNELSTKGTVIKDLCETVSPTFFVKFHRHLKSRVFLGSATVSFLKAGCGERAVNELNGAVVCGCKITVELDDRGDLAKEVYTSKDNRRFSVDSLKSDVTTPTIKPDDSAFFNNHENNRDDAFHSPSSFPAHTLFQKINLISTVKTKSLSSVEGSPHASGFGLATPTGTTPNSGISTKHAFDPILALKTCLLAKKNKAASIPPLPPKEKGPPLPSEAPPPPPEAPPPQVGLEEISSEDEGPKKVAKTFFEDISGEEGSPIATRPRLIVEDISSCEEDGERGNGSVDMDISDTEQNTSQIIEINVRPVTAAPTSHFIQPPLPPPPFPSQTFLNYQLSSEGPKTPPLEPRGDCLDNGGSAHPRSRKSKFSPAKQWKVPLAVTREEKRGQDVLYCALEQLSRILLRDVEKKLVESSAFPVLDEVWDKKESQRSKALGEEEPLETEERVKPQEPYRRMLPGLVPNRSRPQEDDDSTTPITPRKRLMNFKIPLVGSMYRRDNVLTATRRLHFNERRERGTRKRKNHYSDVLPRRKRRHRKEDKDEKRGEYSQLSDISSEEWPSDEGRRIKDRDKNKYKKKERKENAFGPRTPSATSEEEEEEFNKLLQEEEEEEEGQEEKADSDDSSLIFNEIFGSTSSSDFEADIASLRRPQKTKKPSEPAIKKPSNLKEPELIATPPVEDKEEEIERIVEYKKRGEGEEAAILNSFLEEGFDKEDMDMMRSAYVKLKEIYFELISDVSWSYYPHNVVENNVTHSSGCARSEGYYKIDPSDKSRYLHHLRRSKASDDKDKNSAPPPTSSGRGNRLNHRRVASLFTSGDVSRELQQYNQLKARKKQLTFAKSTIHNWGLFALETIPADEMVVEYIGQVVRHGIADERERRYEAQGIGSSYLFRVDYDHVIDATKSGNFARFINHCCDPNCYAKIITVGNQKKIVIYSKRDIRAGEEITYDYKFPIEDEKIPCLCGAPQCRGTLN